MTTISDHIRGGAIVLALLALGCVACGSSSKPSTASTASTASSPSTQAASLSGGDVTTTTSSGGETTTSVAGGTKTGHVGDTLSDPDRFLASDVASVTLVKVIDPVTPKTASNVPDPGKRWVGLAMTFVDNGDNASNASDQALVTGSDGNVYALNADIEGNFTECTSTLSHLQPNQKGTFCPGFLLPNGVTVTKVGYSTRGSETSVPSEVTWTVP